MLYDEAGVLPCMQFAMYDTVVLGDFLTLILSTFPAHETVNAVHLTRCMGEAGNFAFLQKICLEMCVGTAFAWYGHLIGARQD